jgi:myo-inositol-1-phosphate synthase
MGVGVWLIGARGSVATTTVLGAAALRAGLAPPTGCVSTLEPFDGLALPDWADLVFGGHDVVPTTLGKRAGQLAEAGVVPPGWPDLLRADLCAAEAEMRPGIPADPGPAPLAAIEALAADLVDFRRRLHLDRVVVVNVAATEPAAADHPGHRSPAALRDALADPRPAGGPVLPASSCYAYAAVLAGCPYVDFTPSTGVRLPALAELARQYGVPYAGSDGKTGETLVKSVLAPMFAQRALRVLGWSGTNLLGGGDGANLADPDRAASKASSKGMVLAASLGYPVDGGVHIHHLPALGEWKTAWDHILFEGFLGTRMNLEFTWHGCDSTLAAPLVLDLARLMALAHRRGARGPVPELGFFFKNPLGTQQHGLDRQYATLVRWAGTLGGSR